MLTSTSTSTSTATTNAPSPSPASPTRPSRLRGLSYLRNYTHQHLHSRDSSTATPGTSRPFTLTRATSYPVPASSPGASNTTPTRQRSPVQPNTSTASRRPPASELNNPAALETSDTSRAATVEPLDDIASTDGTHVHETTVIGRARSATTSGVPVVPGPAMPNASMTTTTAALGSVPAGTTQTSTSSPNNNSSLPSVRFSQHQDARAQRPSLVFSPMQRTLPTGKEVLKVGRYSEREQAPVQAFNVASAAPVGFKSKVVSRRHCEFWSENGVWYIKDVKSSSGTFLNHVRLSSPGQESKPFAVKDGDIVQLGIDFKGGEEMIFRCVKIRIELNRNWQASLNTFNMATHKRLRNMAKEGQSTSATSSSSSQDCSICLGRVAPCQALFVAPCSHTWHYKCVRRILNGPMWPQFICPNCRAVADLEAEVDEPFEDEEWEEEAEQAANPSTPASAAAAMVIPISTDVPGVADSHPEVEPIHEQTEEDDLPDHGVDASIGDVGRNSTSDSEGAVESAPRSFDLQAHLELARTEHGYQTPFGVDGYISNPQLSNGQSNAVSAPIPIRGSVSRSVREEHRTPSPGGESSEMAPSHIDLPPPLLTALDGPMTPRNDVGPFVFDGSAGRLRAARGPSSEATAANASEHDALS